METLANAKVADKCAVTPAEVEQWIKGLSEAMDKNAKDHHEVPNALIDLISCPNTEKITAFGDYVHELSPNATGDDGKLFELASEFKLTLGAGQ